MEPLEDELGDIIKKARTGIGLTLPQLSEKCGIALNLLEESEAYRYKPPDAELRILAMELSLSLSKLNDIANGKWHPEEYYHDESGNVIMVKGNIGSYKVNGYILMDKKSGVAVAFDTGNDSRKLLDTVKDNGLKLIYIFLTHGHFDHTGGISEICRSTGAGIGVPEWETEIDLDKDITKNVFFVKDGAIHKTGSLDIRAIATPGHTQGSTCYVAEDYCFSGDTIFAGSVGRAYSTAGYKTLLNTISTRILSLNSAVRIFPGHGPATTVREEMMHNPFFSTEVFS